MMDSINIPPGNKQDLPAITILSISKMHLWGQTNLSMGAVLFVAVALLSFVHGCTPAPQALPLTTPTFTTAPYLVPTATVQISGPPPTLQPTPTTIFVPPPAIIEAGQVWINSIDGSEMVGVPAGEFLMGNDEGATAEGPEHTIYLDSYYIDKYEITNIQYRSCVDSGVCAKLEKTTSYDDPDYAHHPVINVTWPWANTYCRWANKRIPTEAEWEKAARGPDGRRYPWGEEIDCEYAQYKECGGQTVPVGSYPKGVSFYGAYDMAGNVWEWVIDEWQEDYYQISPYKNPPGPTNPKNEWNISEIRVFRGGSWSEDGDLLRSTYRSWYEPDAQYYNLGFRCVIDSPKSH